MPEPTVTTFTQTSRSLWRIAWPVILSGIVSLFISGNDAVLLVGASAQVLSSAVASSAIQLVAMLVVAGLVGASQVLISRAIGASRRDHAARAGDTGLWLGLWGGLITAVLLALAGPVILSALAGPAIDGAFAWAYLSITLFALPFGGISSALRARLAGLGQSRGLLIASSCAAVMDIAVAIILNAAIGPFGVAIGTLTGSLTNTLVVTWFAVRRLPARTGVRAPRLVSLVRVRAEDLKELLALGWPEAILFGASAGASVVVTWLLSIGPSADLAASRFLELTISSVVYTVLSGFGTAATTLLSRAAGAGEFPGFLRTIRHTVKLTIGIAAAVLVSGCLGYTALLGLFAPPGVVAASAPVVWLAFAQVPLMALHVPIVSALRSLRDTRTPMVASLVAEYGVFLPLGWYLTRVLGVGLSGVFIDHLVFWTVSVGIVGIRLIPQMRRLAATTSSTAVSENEGANV